MKIYFLLFTLFYFSCSNQVEDLDSKKNDKLLENNSQFFNKSIKLKFRKKDKDISTINYGDIVNDNRINFKALSYVNNVFVSIKHKDNVVFSKFFSKLIKDQTYNLNFFENKLHDGYYILVFDFKNSSREKYKIPFFKYKKDLSIAYIKTNSSSFSFGEKVLISAFVKSKNPNYYYRWSLDNNIIKEGINQTPYVNLIFSAPQKEGMENILFEVFPFPPNNGLDDYNFISTIKNNINIIASKDKPIYNFQFKPTKNLGEFETVGSPSVSFKDKAFGYKLEKEEGFLSDEILINDEFKLELSISFYLFDKSDGLVFFSKNDNKSISIVKKDKNFLTTVFFKNNIYNFKSPILKYYNTLVLKLNKTNMNLLLNGKNIQTILSKQKPLDLKSNTVIGTDNFSGIFENLSVSYKKQDNIQYKNYQLFKEDKIDTEIQKSKNVKVLKQNDKIQLSIPPGEWVKLPRFLINKNKIVFFVDLDKISDYKNHILELSFVNEIGTSMNLLSLSTKGIIWEDTKIGNFDISDKEKIELEFKNHKLSFFENKKRWDLPLYSDSIQYVYLKVAQNINSNLNLLINQIKFEKSNLGIIKKSLLSS